jgi:hypothetical protein
MAASVRSLALLALFAAALVPTRSHAPPSMGANAGPTNSQGDECTTCSSSSSIVPSFLPQSASFGCSNSEGQTSASASSNFGTLTAFASALSREGVNRGSLSAEGVFASASYTDSGIFINTSGNGASTVQGTLNIHFSETHSETGVAAALIDGFGDVNGTTVVHCFGADDACIESPITVPFGVPVSITLRLQALPFANANGQLEDAQAIADASHTFSFPLNGPVFDLPPGFTFNAPDSFIVDNIFAPPSADVGSVPEPGTVSLLLAGLTGLLLTNRGCRRNGLI